MSSTHHPTKPAPLTPEQKKERRKIYDRRYRNKPEVRKRDAERQRAYFARPDVKARMKVYGHLYRQRPGVKARTRVSQAEFCRRQEMKLLLKKYLSRVLPKLPTDEARNAYRRALEARVEAAIRGCSP